MKGDIKENLILREAIEKWPARIREAKLLERRKGSGLERTQKQLAKEAGVSAPQLSQIINFRTNKPRLKTTNAVSRVLQSWGV